MFFTQSASLPGHFINPLPPGKHLWYQLIMMLVGHQSQSARFDEEKNSLPLAEVELSFLGFPTRSLITIRMTLSPLRFNTSCIYEKVIVLVVMSLRFNYCMYFVAYFMSLNFCMTTSSWCAVFMIHLVFVCIPPLVNNDHSLVACVMFAVYHTLIVVVSFCMH